MTYTKTSPFLRFSPFWAFFRQKGDNCSPQAIKRGREGKETPSAHPERLQRKAVGGRRAAAPRFWRARPRPSGCRPSNSGGFAGAPCPSRSASAALAACASLRGVFLRWWQGVGGLLLRPSAARPAPSPPVSPPFRRPRAWSCRCWAWGGGGATPAPAGRLSVVGLVGLAAGRALSCVRATGWRVAFAPFRRARGLPPGACLADGRSACRSVGQSWANHFAGACPPSPAAPV